MVKNLIRSYLVNLFALWVTALYVSGFHLAEGYKSLALVGAGFTALHLVLKPVLKMILGPISLLTLGLIDLAIDGGILYLLTLYFPQISITAWDFPGLSTNYFNLPAVSFNILATTILSAFIINVIRSTLLTLMS